MSLMRRIQQKIEQGKTNDAIARELRAEGNLPTISVSLENYVQRVRAHLARRPSCPICHRAITRTTSSFARNTNEGFVHTECFRANYTRCHVCGNSFRNGTLVSGPHNSLVCPSCRTTRFSRCSTCNEEHRTDDLVTIGRGQNQRIVCRTCREEENPIRNYSYSPRRFNMCKMPWENTTYLGIELEVDPKSTSVDVEANAMDFHALLAELDLKDKFYVKEDASIRGYEIVTHPITLTYMKKNVNWNRIMKFLTKDMVSYDSGRCGMHVHVSKQDLKQQDILKLRLFFMYAQDQLKVLSNRKTQGFHYCEFETKFEDYNNEALTLAKATRMSNPGGRYWALNMNSSKNTLEVRIFRGTLNYDRFMANLCLVESIVEFCKKISVASFISNRNQIWDIYKDSISKNSKYQHLVKFIKKNHKNVW